MGESLEGARFADEDVLPDPGELGLQGHARLHLWGPGFGDSAVEGIAYGPVALNRLQNETIEAFLRNRRTGRTRLEAIGYYTWGEAGGWRVPFVESVSYRITLDDGTIARFDFWMDGDEAKAALVR